MCQGIMDLSNALIYGDRLRCGTSEIANAKLEFSGLNCSLPWLENVRILSSIFALSYLCGICIYCVICFVQQSFYPISMQSILICFFCITFYVYVQLNILMSFFCQFYSLVLFYLIMDVYLLQCLTPMTNEKLREQFTLQLLRSQIK